MPRQIKPFGSWKSPISAQSLFQSSLRLGQLQVDGQKIFWTEGRPSEKGRTALMVQTSDKGIHEISVPGWDVRTRVHEYGGGAFLANQEQIFFIDNEDQQLYQMLDGGTRRKLTDRQHFRYADMALDTQRDQVYVIGEDHSDPMITENMLLRISLNGDGGQHVIHKGHDFYSNPQVSANGHQLTFITWDHPNMPWDSTCLWIGDLDEYGNISQLKLVAGGEEESIFQPLWDPDGDLYFVSDKNGWWNIYRYSQGLISCILKMEAEFGLPQWIFGMSTYAVLSQGKLIANYRDLQGSHLIRIDVEAGHNSIVETPYTDIDQIRGSGDLIAFIGSAEDRPSEIVSMDLDSREKQVLRHASEIDLPKAYISKAELTIFELHAGEPTYGWYYPPKNPDYEASQSALPPLIVLSHGGPTTFSSGAFSLTIQYWTTRGFAIVDVNYSGSTGFGREYRQRLNRSWGIRDVEDCVGAAKHLCQSGSVDPDRLIIKGGSAGGYTTLAALTFTNIFKAGASYYGIGDLELLAKDTHKFESHYLDRLVGTYPEEKELYEERSPIHHIDQMDCPVIFLQGLDDPVVPPNQAEIMVASLKQKGVPVAYTSFAGESHGFRQAATLVRAIENEFYFYSRVFGIEPADSLEPIRIFNL